MKRKRFGECHGRMALVLCLLCGIAFALPETSGAAQYRQKKDRSKNSATKQTGTWTIGIGVTTEFLWWRPGFSESLAKDRMFAILNQYLPTTNESFSMDPAFSVGPVLTIGMPRGFSLTASFLWSGWFEAETSIIDPTGAAKTISETSIKRWELDAAFNYSIVDIVKLFFGLRYESVDLSYKGTIYPYPYTIPDGFANRDDSIYGIGPELGMAADIRLAGPVSLAGRFSLLYLYTSYDSGKHIENSVSMDFYHVAYHLGYHTIGFDASISVSWNIAAANTTIALGFRYRYLHYSKWGGKSDSTVQAYLDPPGTTAQAPAPDFLTEDDHLYGITLSATYEFTL